MRRAALIAAFAALLALAAMQPVVRTQTSLRARTDAQAFVILDVSRSMAASPAPGRPLAARAGAQRGALHRGPARRRAGRARDAHRPCAPGSLPDVGSSAPSTRRRRRSPSRIRRRARSTPSRRRSTPSARSRPRGSSRKASTNGRSSLVTDGESRPFDPTGVARSLGASGIQLALVRVGDGADRVWRPDGKPEANFRPDPRGAALSIGRLASAAHAPDGSRLRAGRRASARQRAERRRRRAATDTLARAAARDPRAVPLGLLLGAGGARRRLRGVTFSNQVPAAGEGEQ